MRDERHRRLLRLEGISARQLDADVLEAEQRLHLDVLLLVRAGRVAPRVATALVTADAQVRADLLVQPLREALGGLHRQAVDEVALAELALAFELLAELGRLRPDGNRL